MPVSTAPTLLATTTVGSYPRPRWYTRRAGGADLREALMEQTWREEYEDALKAVLNDQEMAGLDIVSDGEMYEDDLVGGAGWPEYVLARLGGLAGRADSTIGERLQPAPILGHMFEAWPSRVVTSQLARGPLRFAWLYRLASQFARAPLKVAFPDPQLLATLVRDSHYSTGGVGDSQLVSDLVAIYNQELIELAAAGCPMYQSDVPPFARLGLMGASEALWKQAIGAFNAMVEGTQGMAIWMHSCWGRAFGQLAFLGRAGDYRPMFSRVFDANFHVLNVEYSGLGPELELLRQVPADRAVALGVVDPRVLQVETAEQVAARIRPALRHIPPERLYLTGYCGLGSTLPRTIAFYKLKALVEGAALVRAELTGERGSS